MSETRVPTPEELEAALASVESEISAVNSVLERHRVHAKEQLAPLAARRDQIATALSLHRAGLSRLIKPAAIESGEEVGTPGA